MVKVVGLGAGGHAKILVEILSFVDSIQIKGLLDPNEALWNTEVLGIPVLGNDDLLFDLKKKGITHAFIGLGTIGDTSPRRKLFEKAQILDFDLVNAIHPTAIISNSATMDPGITVMASAVINAEAKLGKNVIVNTSSVIEHDCVIGDHSHIATGARLASTVTVGEGAHIGAGATVRQSITIGEGAIVGAGAVVVDDVKPWNIVVGVPARFLKHHVPEFP